MTEEEYKHQLRVKRRTPEIEEEIKKRIADRDQKGKEYEKLLRRRRV